MASDPCVYTALIGRYEALNEQPAAAGSRVRFICLTDDPELTSTSWECRLVRPPFAMDPIRSQRSFKMLPHVHLPEFDGSIYIDNSIVLTAPPEAVWAMLPPGAGIAMPRHSFRDTVLDEFLAVVQLGLEDSARVFEQLNHYALACPEVLAQAPWWSGFLLRDHRDRQVQQAMEHWLAQVYRYARRDQLSVNMALHAAGLRPAEMPIDNHHSHVHRWPIALGRDRNRGARNPLANLAPLAGRVHALERALEAPAPPPDSAEAATLRLELAALQTRLDKVLGSTSWRATASMRFVVDRARAALARVRAPRARAARRRVRPPPARRLPPARRPGGRPGFRCRNPRSGR